MSIPITQGTDVKKAFHSVLQSFLIKSFSIYIYIVLDFPHLFQLKRYLARKMGRGFISRSLETK